MKKKGLTWAFMGALLGAIVLIILIGITIKLLSSYKDNDCINNIDWINLKEKLKDAEAGKSSTTLFKNEGCYLVSFSLTDINSPSSNDKINPPDKIKKEQRPAICLCDIEGNDCNIKDDFKNCYIFYEINNFQMSEQYNSGDSIKEDKNYIFITLENTNSNFLIKDDVKAQPSTTSPPPITPGGPIFLNPEDQIA